MEEQRRAELQQLAEQLNIRDPRKLYQAAARREVRGVSLQEAKEALRGDVARQLFRRKPRSAGKFAASGPDEWLQADLIDFAANARSTSGARFALLLADVYTREIAAVPLFSKRPKEVSDAMRTARRRLGVSGGDFTLSTDKGGEFAGAQHQLKEAPNDLAIVDRAMQTLKKDLAGLVAKKGGTWDQHLKEAVDAYNARPHEAVYGPPEDVDKGGVQEFLVLRRNARAFAHNRRLTERRVKALEDEGAFRAPVATGGRSFNPQFGEVRTLQRIEEGKRFVTDSRGRRALLKEVQPVPASSGPAAGRLTNADVGQRQRFKRVAEQLARYLGDGAVRVEDLPLGPLLRGQLRSSKVSVVQFLQLFPELFEQRDGLVRRVG